MSCPLRHVIKDSEQLRERGGRKVYEDVFWTSFFDFNFIIGNFIFVNMICNFFVATFTGENKLLHRVSSELETGVERHLVKFNRIYTVFLENWTN